MTWRVLGTLGTFSISLSITNRIDIASMIAIVEFIFKSALYWFHERVWAYVKWGRES